MNEFAEAFVVFVHPDGRRVPGRIGVARPEQRSTGEWGCRVLADGVVNSDQPIYGETSLQALVLALRFLAMQLHHFLATGGRALDPHDDSDLRLDLTFGRLWPAQSS